MSKGLQRDQGRLDLGAGAGLQDYSEPFEVEAFEVVTDASDYAMGAVLYQEVEGQRRVVAYSSHKLNEAQRRYTVHERELLSVVTALKE